MVKMITVYSIPEGTDPDKFWKYHTEEHAIDFRDAARPFLKKYVINRVLGSRGEPKFFGLIETWWDSEEDRQAYNKRSHPKRGEFSSRVVDSFTVLVEEKEIPL